MLVLPTPEPAQGTCIRRTWSLSAVAPDGAGGVPVSVSQRKKQQRLEKAEADLWDNFAAFDDEVDMQVY